MQSWGNGHRAYLPHHIHFTSLDIKPQSLHQLVLASMFLAWESFSRLWKLQRLLPPNSSPNYKCYENSHTISSVDKKIRAQILRTSPNVEDERIFQVSLQPSNTSSNYVFFFSSFYLAFIIPPSLSSCFVTATDCVLSQVENFKNEKNEKTQASACFQEASTRPRNRISLGANCTRPVACAQFLGASASLGYWVISTCLSQVNRYNIA